MRPMRSKETTDESDQPPRLVVKEYLRWARAMEAHLLRKQLFCVVSAEAAQLLSSEEGIPDSRSAWMLRGKNDAAVQEIRSGLPKTLELEMMSHREAWSLWKAVREHCFHETTQMITDLRNDIFTPIFEEGDDWSEYYQRKMEAYHMLQETKGRVTEAELVRAVFEGIVHPHYIETRITALMRGWKTITKLKKFNSAMESVRSSMARKSRASESPALIADAKGDDTKKRQLQKCDFCRNLGRRVVHLPDQCWVNPKSPNYRGAKYADVAKSRFKKRRKTTESKPKNQAQAHVTCPRPGLRDYVSQ